MGYIFLHGGGQSTIEGMHSFTQCMCVCPNPGSEQQGRPEAYLDMCYLFVILTLLQLYEWESRARSPGLAAVGPSEFARKQTPERAVKIENTAPQ